jgi:PiT family inorganic phosphate transporter
MELTLIVALVLVALTFDFTNGFHDAADAIATSVSTHALTPRVALVLAAVMNFIGAFLGQAVARTVSETISPDGSATHGLVIVTGGLLGAIAWNLLTWYLGLPSSSSHALIGGLVGAALASGSVVRWTVFVDKVLIPMVVSPVVGFSLAFALMLAVMWGFRRANPHRTNRGFRMAQTVSAAAMALGHGLQDAQKTMGVIFLALLTGGYVSAGDPLPVWVIAAAAAAISLGTYAGGWRIIRTLGRRIIHLDPPSGFVSETLGRGRALRDRRRVRGAHLDHVHHHLCDRRRRRHPSGLRGPVGRGPPHRGRLAADLPGRWTRRSGRLPVPQARPRPALSRVRADLVWRRRSRWTPHSGRYPQR